MKWKGLLFLPAPPLPSCRQLYDDLVDHLHDLEVKLDRLEEDKPP